MTALKSSFFVPKSRKTYGCEIPARFATSSVEAPWRPRAANSSSAASRTASRRSSAVLRSVAATMAGKLAITHYYVKSLLDEKGHAPGDADRRPYRPLGEAAERLGRVD